jgi:hypothetical protein
MVDVLFNDNGFQYHTGLTCSSTYPVFPLLPDLAQTWLW